MPKKSKAAKAKAKVAAVRRLVGKGDYDFYDLPSPGQESSKMQSDLVGLNKRVGKLEKGVQGSTAKQAFAKVGEDVGSLFGMGSIGKRLGNVAGSLFGHGDYVVQTNSLMPGKAQSGPSGESMIPAFSRNGKRGIRVTEREFIGDIRAGTTLVNGATTFNSQSFRINPGLNSTFPWLSTLAGTFEEWEPLGLVFEFRTTSAAFNGASQALGKVIMATDYDSLDSPYVNAIQMEDSDYACSVVASASAMHGIECEPTERGSRVLYTRNAAIPTGGTILDFDLANFQIATQGMNAAGVVVGELWVSYDIAFYKKELFAGQLGNSVLTSFSTSAIGVNPATPFGTFGNISGTFFVKVSGTTVTFPSWLQTGVFYVVLAISGATTTLLTGSTANTFVNCTPIVFDGVQLGAATGVDPISSFQSPLGNNVTGNLIVPGLVKITGPSASITYTMGTLPVGPTSTWAAFQLPMNVLPVLLGDVG